MALLTLCLVVLELDWQFGRLLFLMTHVSSYRPMGF